MLDDLFRAIYAVNGQRIRVCIQYGHDATHAHN